MTSTQTTIAITFETRDDAGEAENLWAYGEIKKHERQIKADLAKWLARDEPHYTPANVVTGYRVEVVNGDPVAERRDR